LSLSLLIAGMGLCCGKQAPDTGKTGDSSDKAVAGQKILEADQLYAQREDLSKVRLGVALLRQARIADYGNYEAAWKLAKFDYYLGAHTSDERERDTAFREGIDSGRLRSSCRKISRMGISGWELIMVAAPSTAPLPGWLTLRIYAEKWKG